MSIDKISSSTTMNFNTDYFQRKISNETENKGESVSVPQQKLNQSEKEDPKDNVKQVIDSLNKFLEPNNTSLKFELHEELNEYYVTIVNDKTHEVVREIPSKKILDIYAAMTEFLGFVVDKKI
ncbi:flagellar protein FlaG [Bacillus sp. REN16]|uniref:flagellar protein FlaG n=1 Tax=Bacillus sp. REN16 TaxID=2887296 RepID=UPI001E55D0C1|nr:flagellar protein FlaG [Bacillus sp. REN16]MCC3356947.1 flagellar protein FlaG [Bacillus sp. REN16]